MVDPAAAVGADEEGVPNEKPPAGLAVLAVVLLVAPKENEGAVLVAAVPLVGAAPNKGLDGVVVAEACA